MKLIIVVAIAVGVVAVVLLFGRRSQLAVDSRREMNERAFANMRAKTKWDLSGNMLWGFFFTNATREPLVPAAEELEKEGYRIVDIYQDDQKENWWLHVERVEIHTVDSLTRREHEFVQIAEGFRLGSYDGWDVGPAIK